MKEIKKENNALIIILVALLAIFLIGTSGYGMMGFGGCPMFGLGYAGSSFGMRSILSPIISLLVIIAIILFIIWLVKQIQEKKCIY